MFRRVAATVPGSFLGQEFMIKDANCFAKTGDWGYAEAELLVALANGVRPDPGNEEAQPSIEIVDGVLVNPEPDDHDDQHLGN